MLFGIFPKNSKEVTMSNYVYNNFDNNDNDENFNITYVSPAKARNNLPLIIVGVVLATLFVASVFFGCLLVMVARGNANNTVVPAPQVNNTVSYVSTNEKSNAALLENEESRVAVIARIKDSVVKIKSSSGSGSGVIVGKFENSNDQKGYYIITNAHVVESSNMQSSSIVTLNDGTEYKSILCGIDTRSDIAVLQIVENQKELNCAVWANENNQLLVGEEIIVIGYPLGVLDNTVTNGYLSAVNTSLSISGVEMNLLQLDATVNPGNSGGGLFNRYGELIGIVNAKVVGENAEGIGFAIPYGEAIKVSSDLRDYGYVTGRPTLGIITKETVQGFVQVTAVTDGSPLRVGDIILRVKLPGESTYSNVTKEQLDNIIYDLGVGKTLSLEIRRNRMTTQISVTTFEYKNS